jgi:uncharacterized protein (DUF1501 family)
VLRGGFDSLSAVVPTDENLMRKIRKDIFIPNASLLPLDREFGLHPSLKKLLPLWEAKELAIVNTLGAPTHSRSHFDEISDVAYAAYGEKDKRSGWIARFLDVAGSGSVVQSVGIGSTTRQLIGGKAAPVNLESINNFKLDSIFGYKAEDLAGFIDETHGRWTNIWAAQAKSTIQALDQVALATAQKSTVTYPNTGTGQRFRDVAALLKAGIGVRAVDLEYQGDWDMHANMGTLDQGWLTSSLADIAGSISAFREDLGVVWSRVTVVTVTEFGRRVSQNQSSGTEHGWGSSTFVAGGGVNGGKIHGKFPGLDEKVLKDGDLVVTADYRSLLTEILTRRAGITAEGASQVFPNSVFAHCIYIRSPSWRSTAGSNPRSLLAAEISARLSRTSPFLGAAYRTVALMPDTSSIIFTSRFILIRWELPRLKAPETPTAAAARQLASATSSTFMKSRVCSPSP